MERIPKDVVRVLKKLTDAGHEAWCVGGCVRDLLLDREPGDWDATTSALPEETLALFGADAVPTGLQHGTVTVRTGIRHVEVTTYRTDGDYTDHRHPEGVTFTSSLKEDLRRRDFTVNAIAMSGTGELQDPVNGKADLAAGCLRCVGDPNRRFDEDALRILRGLRFASVLGFDIEEKTAAGMRGNRELLRSIAAERIRVEWDKLLCGVNAGKILREYPDIFGVFLPEILPAIGFAQRSRYHCYDVWEHTIRSVESVPPEPVLRMAMLLHDLGKPETFLVDADGEGHFYGHPKRSKKLAEDILARLRYDNESKRRILTLVELHDWPVSATEKSVGRALRRLGEADFRRLLLVKRADNLAQAVEYRNRQAEIDEIERVMEALLRREACFSLKQLAVSGHDLLKLGFSGPAIGTVLEELLSAVIDGELENDREKLLRFAEKKNRKS